MIKMADTKGTMLDVKNYFGYSNIAEFKRDWTSLSDEDKDQLKAGIANGSLTY